MIHISRVLTLILFVTALSGCTSIQDHFVDLEMGTRNHILAQQGWNEWSWCYEELDHPYHFARGFKSGYRNILSGGNGCQPTFPPRCYWKPHFQSPEGRCKTMAWFDGYSHGALAAQQDGFGNLNEIPISPTARANMISQQAPVSPEVYNQMYGTTSDVPEAVPSAADTGATSIGNPVVPIPPVQGDTETEIAIPVRPYDD